LLPFDGIVVTEKTMPKLYGYVRTLCQENQLAMPAVWLPKDKGLYNAMAAKLFQSSGGIIIGQDLINDCSDDELEAIVAHEIGHIKHNHVNKIMAVGAVSCVVGYCIARKYCPDSLLGSWATGVLTRVALESVIIGKKFEREADAFACQNAHKAAGLASFFKRLEDKGHKVDEQFALVRAQLDANKDNLKSDYNSLNFRFQLAKVGRSFGKAVHWFYHNTPFGPHPSPEERISSAQRYLVQ
jgi:Zn-dependent protease with chaperone function